MNHGSVAGPSAPLSGRSDLSSARTTGRQPKGRGTPAANGSAKYVYKLHLPLRFCLATVPPATLLSNKCINVFSFQVYVTAGGYTNQCY